MPLNFYNLIENLCPFCGRKLAEFRGKVYCISCKFEIDKERAERIREAKKKSMNGHQKNKWQNLKYNKCIKDGCEREITPAIDGNFEVMKCVNPNCDFQITITTFNKILNDPNHYCNMIETKRAIIKKGKVEENDGAYRYERY